MLEHLELIESIQSHQKIGSIPGTERILVQARKQAENSKEIERLALELTREENIQIEKWLFRCGANKETQEQLKLSGREFALVNLPRHNDDIRHIRLITRDICSYGNEVGISILELKSEIVNSNARSVECRM